MALEFADAHFLPFSAIEAFPSLGDELMVVYADAAGEGVWEGMGFWFVVGNVCFFFCDKWLESESHIKIHAREAYIATAATMAAHVACPARRFCLEYTDNTPTECVHEKQSARCPLLQTIIEARSQFFDASGVCALPQRVSSKHNLWADWLSRGEWRRAVAAMVECGLRPQWVGAPHRASVLRSVLRASGS